MSLPALAAAVAAVGSRKWAVIFNTSPPPPGSDRQGADVNWLLLQTFINSAESPFRFHFLLRSSGAGGARGEGELAALGMELGSACSSSSWEGSTPSFPGRVILGSQWGSPLCAHPPWQGYPGIRVGFTPLFPALLFSRVSPFCAHLPWQGYPRISVNFVPLFPCPVLFPGFTLCALPTPCAELLTLSLGSPCSQIFLVLSCFSRAESLLERISLGLCWFLMSVLRGDGSSWAQGGVCREG